ncbi:MAG: Nif3-like dinuclear metal center hexameric protein [Planctomycetaceae bacterium]
MVRIAEVVTVLESIAPLSLAEEWDNVGLLLGDADAEISVALTCLTLTSDVASEAIQAGAGLIISHHPILFRPVQQITTESWEGRLLLDLLRAGIAVYSAHTAYDSARDGINAELAQQLKLSNVAPIRPKVALSGSISPSPSPPIGSGRCGQLRNAIALKDFVATVGRTLKAGPLQFAGDENAMVSKVGIACGSAAEFLSDAKRAGCQVLLTGEARFHSYVEAREIGIALVTAGHYATERPAMERFAKQIESACAGLKVSASSVEQDPVKSC